MQRGFTYMKNNLEGVQSEDGGIVFLHLSYSSGTFFVIFSEKLNIFKYDLLEIPFVTKSMSTWYMAMHLFQHC